MPSKKLVWLVTSLMLVFALVLGACGGQETAAPTQPPATGDTPAAPATQPPASGDQVTITVAAGAVGQELELAQQAAQRYMDMHSNVTVRVLETPDMVQDRLGLYLQFFEAQSSEVDVYQVDVIWPGDLQEHFVDLYEYGARDVADQHFPAIIENNTVDGRLVAIPWFTDAGLLY
jgi:trehalose/maltose transport system substrate-binding protein